MQYLRPLVSIGLLLIAFSFEPRPLAAAPDPLGLFSCNVQALLGSVVPFIPASSTTIDLGNGQQLTVQVCAQSENQQSVGRILDRTRQALPILAQRSGLRLDGSRVLRIFVLPQDKLPHHIDGRYFTDMTVIEIGDQSFDGTLIHELAHHWSNATNFDQRELWMIEGYADYLMWMIEHTDGYTDQNRAWFQQNCANIALAEIHDTTHAQRECVYQGGLAVFRDIAAIVGHERLAAALHTLSDGTRKINHRDLLIELERDNLAVDLVPIMKRVFLVYQHPRLERRAALRADLRAVTETGQALEIATPTRIAPLIDAERFDDAASWIASLHTLIEAGAAVTSRCQLLTIDCDDSWKRNSDSLAVAAQADRLKQAIPGLDAMLALQELQQQTGLEPRNDLRIAAATLQPDALDLGFLQAARAMLEDFKQLQERARAIERTLPADLRDPVAALDLSAHARIRDGHSIFDAFEQTQQHAHTLGFSLSAPVLDAVAAIDARPVPRMRQAEPIFDSYGQLLAQARSYGLTTDPAITTRLADLDLSVVDRIHQAQDALTAGISAEQGCASFALDCISWREPWQKGDFQTADEQVRSLAALAAQIAQIESACMTLRVDCRPYWHQAYQSGGLAAANQMLDSLANLTAEAQKLSTDCASAGWPCTNAWQSALAAGPEAAHKRIAALQAALIELAATDKLSNTDSYLRQISAQRDGTSNAPPVEIDLARKAFASGNIEQALLITRELRKLAEQERRLLLFARILAAAIVVVLMVAGSLAWRRSRRKKTSDMDLLRNLLSTPPTS